MKKNFIVFEENGLTPSLETINFDTAIRFIVKQKSPVKLFCSTYPTEEEAEALINSCLEYITQVSTRIPRFDEGGIELLKTNKIPVILEEIAIEDVEVEKDYLIFELVEKKFQSGIIVNTDKISPMMEGIVIKSGDENLIPLNSKIVVEIESTQELTIGSQKFYVTHPRHVLGFFSNREKTS